MVKYLFCSFFNFDIFLFHLLSFSGTVSKLKAESEVLLERTSAFLHNDKFLFIDSNFKIIGISISFYSSQILADIKHLTEKSTSTIDPYP